MSYLADTNLLVRLANTQDSWHPVANEAVDRLHRQGEVITITPQNLIEFRAVATRPLPANGLGMSVTAVEAKTAEFEATFALLEENSTIYPLWKNLVAASGVIGKQVHDARLVAVCHAHGVTHLLTFSGAHFVRLAGIGPGIEVVDPAAV